MASTTSAASPGARLPAHYIINSSTYQTVGDRAFVADCDMTDYIKKGDEYAKIFSTKANATLDVELGCVPGTDPKSGKARSGVRYLQSVLATKAQGAQRKQERTKAAATRVQTELAQAAAARQTTWQHQNVQEQLIAQLAASNAQQTAAMRQEGASLAAATLAAREIGDAMGASGNTCLGDGGSGMCSNCGDVSLPHRCIFSDSKVLRMSQKGEGSLSGHTPRATKGSMGSNSFKEVDEEEDKQGDGAVTATRATSRKRCKSSEASTSSGLSAYELQRQANVDKNRAKLVAFGIESPSAKPPAKKAKSSSPKSKASPPPPPPIIPADPAAWMNKPGVDWNKDACELFGQRIKMKNPKTKQMEKAVIKAWQPFEATDQFAVVFDSMPDKVFKENLLRKGSRGRDWQLDTWEGDVEETAELRPICTQCGMALGMGRAAWTLCPGGCMEPGAMSTQMLPRLRSGDPNRRPHVDYKEADIDSD